MDVFEVEEALGRRVAGRVPQLWGRSVPNRGFGPALAIPELDDSVYDVYTSFVSGISLAAGLASLAS
jgi:hypothetical protein